MLENSKNSKNLVKKKKMNFEIDEISTQKSNKNFNLKTTFLFH